MTTFPQAASKSSLYLLHLKNVPIFQQLQIEEALLRADERNWCIINSGSSPAIVMGISGKPELLLDQELLTNKPVSIIRRFSGGGTVFVDANTLFVSWIFNVQDVGVACCPVKIHRWSESFYQTVFPSLGMRLVENDYVLGDRKFGGNAQYLCKQRWLHHSSLLWDYDEASMQYLLMPKKIPTYRNQRNHHEFLCKLCDHLPSKEYFEQSIIQRMKEAFALEESIAYGDVYQIAKEGTHRRATQLINEKI